MVGTVEDEEKIRNKETVPRDETNNRKEDDEDKRR